MIRRPPRSTLFPTRRSSDLSAKFVVARGQSLTSKLGLYCAHAPRPVPGQGSRRSEEHTSELQSRPHLVCRLLLEKKKNNLNNYKFISKTHYYNNREITYSKT